jgi:hypothetical protein
MIAGGAALSAQLARASSPATSSNSRVPHITARASAAGFRWPPESCDALRCAKTCASGMIE